MNFLPPIVAPACLAQYEQEVAELEAAIAESSGEKKALHEQVLSEVSVFLERVKGALSTKRKKKTKMERAKERELKKKIMENLQREREGRATKDVKQPFT